MTGTSTMKHWTRSHVCTTMFVLLALSYQFTSTDAAAGVFGTTQTTRVVRNTLPSTTATTTATATISSTTAESTVMELARGGGSKKKRPTKKRVVKKTTPTVKKPATAKKVVAKPVVVVKKQPVPQKVLVTAGPKKFPKRKLNPRFVNAVQRVVTSGVLLTGGFLYFSKFQRNGVLPMVVGLQFLMFSELKGVLKLDNSSWWWFLTVLSGSEARELVKLMPLGERGMRLAAALKGTITYFMALLGGMATLISMESEKQPSPMTFRNKIYHAASSVIVAFTLIGFSSFWIAMARDFGLFWLFYSIALVAVNDTMAYLLGSLFGKKRLIPNISPKKTVEGFVGAAISSTMVSIITLQSVFPESDLHDMLKHGIAMGVFASLFAPFGDFLASAVKRAHGAEDYSNIVPGHGGIMDRVDSHLVMAPLAFYYLSVIESTL
eukprot:CAMPEP_0118701296 /NCGR_PEP_ID=MMETSP0800-20121206/17162_1 /TAXON_ID=210618 ORGANISM="Striatella unipunctata, Strain CCMP2910" /NCGR_SAMPLE_ID=MMETSP0800 /ASSEMBLY_ACC=CAM_ASM_000638 /LENGTH=434 /DNA_ID=CAMNT_0006602181 /DNA_START=22 /DNA_END=1326 /DNA_ORIENTATION=-